MSEPTQESLDEACEAVGINRHSFHNDLVWNSVKAHARTLDKLHNRTPIDPDILAVREILAEWYQGDEGRFKLRDGKFDADDDFQAALTTYKSIKAGQ